MALDWKEEEPGLWSGSNERGVVVEAVRMHDGRWCVWRGSSILGGPCRTRSEAIRDYEEWSALPEADRAKSGYSSNHTEQK